MTMQQVTMSEYLKTWYGSFPHCGSCVCQKCLYWWSGRCPEGECYDDKRAKEVYVAETVGGCFKICADQFEQLGTYKTEEREMEVLDMIATQSALCNAGVAVYLVDEIEKAWYMDMPEE